MSDHFVSIKVSTWNRESYGLYDYESSNRVKTKFKILSDSHLIHTNRGLSVVPVSSRLSSNCNHLLTFTKGQNCFILNSNYSELKSINIPYNRPWLVVRSIKTASGYYLSEGDTLRLGKVKLKVREIHGPKLNKRVNCIPLSKHVYQGGLGEIVENTEELQIVNTFDSEDKGNNCRICLLEDNSDANPLVKPCKCSGSMGLIHIQCLQQWFKSKVAIRGSNNAKNYSWESLKCELCKFNYPDKLVAGNVVFDLMIVDRPKGNFITLEGGPKETKSINIISFQNQKHVRLGRSNESDIRLGDISVSRSHANIHFSQEGFCLSDIRSKFGTLVKITKPIALTFGFKFGVQCGRHYIKISIQKPFSLLSCFGGCGTKKRLDKNARSGRGSTEDNLSNEI